MCIIASPACRQAMQSTRKSASQPRPQAAPEEPVQLACSTRPKVCTARSMSAAPMWRWVTQRSRVTPQGGSARPRPPGPGPTARCPCRSRRSRPARYWSAARWPTGAGAGGSVLAQPRGGGVILGQPAAHGLHGLQSGCAHDAGLRCAPPSMRRSVRALASSGRGPASTAPTGALRPLDRHSDTVSACCAMSSGVTPSATAALHARPVQVHRDAAVVGHAVHRPHVVQRQHGAAGVVVRGLHRHQRGLQAHPFGQQRLFEPVQVHGAVRARHTVIEHAGEGGRAAPRRCTCARWTPG